MKPYPKKKRNLHLNNLSIGYFLFADISVIRQNILQNISEIADELYVDELQEELMERNILSEEVFDDLSKKFPDNVQQQVIELIVDLLKLGRTSYLVDVMMCNGMDALVSKLVIPEKETGLEDKDKNISQGKQSTLII